MAEAFGTAAAVIQLAQLSVQVLATGYAFLTKLLKAPTEIRQLLTEVAALDCVLGRLQTPIGSGPPAVVADDTVLALRQAGVFIDCNDLLQHVRKLLESCAATEADNKFKNAARRMAWPLKEKEVSECLQQLSRIRGILSAALEANSAQAIGRIEQSQNVVRDRVEALTNIIGAYIKQEDIERVLSWLYPQSLRPKRDVLQSMLSLRHPGTGRWFLESPEFHRWRQDPGGDILWVTGLPGAGKSVLCAIVVEYLQTSIRSPERPVLSYFCGDKAQDENHATRFLMSLALQLASHSAECLAIAFRRHKENNDRTLTLPEYLSLVEACMAKCDGVYIIVDGLDEVGRQDPHEQETLISVLNQILSARPGKAHDASLPDCPLRGSRKLIVASRESVIVRDRLRCGSERHIFRLYLQNCSGVEADLEKYVAGELQRRIDLGKLRLRDRRLAGEIQAKITQLAGTFLQANLQLDYITNMRSDRELRLALHKFPNGIMATYEWILSSLAEQYPTRQGEIRDVLRWLLVCCEALSTCQIAEATSIQPGDRQLDFDGIVTDPNDVIEPLSQLVSVGEGSLGNKSSIVQLSHLTVTEYLISDDILRGRAAAFHINMEDAHAMAAEKCLQYLSFGDFDLDPTQDLDDLGDDNRWRCLLGAGLKRCAALHL